MGKREDVITLGSGKLYLVEYTSSNFPTTAEACKALCIEDNRLAYISGGATLNYESETETVSDDLGYVKKVINSSEDVTLKSGLMTWNGNTLAKLCDTARVSDDTTTGFRTVKIGGLGNSTNKSYVVIFSYEDAEDGDLLVAIRGKSSGSFEITFAKDDATVIDAEFTALAADDDGTLIYLFEEIDTAA